MFSLNPCALNAHRWTSNSYKSALPHMNHNYLKNWWETTQCKRKKKSILCGRDIAQLIACLLTTHKTLGLIISKPNIMTHTNNLSTREVETVGLGVQGHLWLHRKFEASLGSIRHCLNVPLLPPTKSSRSLLGTQGTWGQGGQTNLAKQTSKQSSQKQCNVVCWCWVREAFSSSKDSSSLFPGSVQKSRLCYAWQRRN